MSKTIPVGGYFVYGVPKEIEAGIYYEWVFNRVEVEYKLKDVPPLWPDDNDSLLVFGSLEEMLKWAEKNIKTYMNQLPYWKSFTFSQIAEIIQTEYA